MKAQGLAALLAGCRFWLLGIVVSRDLKMDLLQGRAGSGKGQCIG